MQGKEKPKKKGKSDGDENENSGKEERFVIFATNLVYLISPLIWLNVFHGPLLTNLKHGF